MIAIKEGEKRAVKIEVVRVTGSGTITLTTPQRRILDASRVVVTGFDWATASWDSANNEIVALFDSTVSVLSAVGRYYVQLRGTIGSELYAAEVMVEVSDWGP